MFSRRWSHGARHLSFQEALVAKVLGENDARAAEARGADLGKEAKTNSSSWQFESFKFRRLILVVQQNWSSPYKLPGFFGAWQTTCSLEGQVWDAGKRPERKLIRRAGERGIVP